MARSSVSRAAVTAGLADVETAIGALFGLPGGRHRGPRRRGDGDRRALRSPGAVVTAGLADVETAIDALLMGVVEPAVKIRLLIHRGDVARIGRTTAST